MLILQHRDPLVSVFKSRPHSEAEAAAESPSGREFDREFNLEFSFLIRKFNLEFSYRDAFLAATIAEH